MFQYCICVMALFSSLTDSNHIVPAFRDSILEGNVHAAVDMISLEAVLEVDSVLTNYPEQIISVLSYFCLAIELPELEDMDGKQLLIEILSSPAVSGAIVLLGVSPKDPLRSSGRSFVPVEYGFPGSRDTVFLEILSENDEWKIRDFFEILP